MEFIKVGIILIEDNKKNIVIKVPEKVNYYIINGTQKINLSTNSTYIISIEKDKLKLSDKNNSFYKLLESEITIDNDEGYCLENYIKIQKVVSGRSFHWRKSITQKLPKKLIIKKHNSYLQVINHLPLELYLMGVATSEMSGECPASFLKAQIIVARSWSLTNIGKKHNDYDVCNDDCCQRYQGIGKISKRLYEIFNETKGEVLYYKSQICDTRYSKCCGGISEEGCNVWKEITYPYLNSVVDYDNNDKENNTNIYKRINADENAFCSPKIIPAELLPKFLGRVDEVDNYFRWQTKYSSQELVKLLENKAKISIKEIIDLKPGKRGKSGRLIELTIVYIDKDNKRQNLLIESEYQIRFLLHPSFLYSSAFIIGKTKNQNNKLKKIIIKGAGWGHGVGLCQMGALGMALKGYNYKKILYHYFPKTKIGII